MLGITNVSNAPSIVLRGKIVSSWSNLPSSGTDSDMKTAGYTYYASITEEGTMENSIAEITFSDTDAKSGNYAPICRTYAGEIRVYSKVNTSITIPSIVIHSTVETYNYTLDSGPVEGSTKAVMSGGVYDALANGTQKGYMCGGAFVVGQKMDTAWVQKSITFTSFSGDSDYFTNNSGASVTVKKSGVCIVNFILTVSNIPSSGARIIPVIRKNGGNIQIMHHDNGAGDGSVSMCVIIPVNANDTVSFAMNGNTAEFTVAGSWSNFQIAYLGR